MNITFQVALDTTDDPPVVINPKHPEVEPGKHFLRWVPTGATKFKFDAFDPQRYPFSNVVIKDVEITAQYENRESKREFPYVITVISDGKPYKSAIVDADGHIRTGGSTIKNK